MKKRIVTIFLSSMMALGVVLGGTTISPVRADAATYSFSGGKGTAKNPYQIASVSDLKHIDQNLKAHYVLKKDLDLKGKSFESIGGVTMEDMASGTMKQSFSGSFDGNGHTISNVKCKSAKGEIAVGFFGCNTGNIKNVVFKNVKSDGGKSAMATGAVAGMSVGGSIKNTTLKGKTTVTGTNCVGGIVGGNMGGNITKCKASGTTIQVTGDNDFSDGLIIQCDVAECGGIIVGGGFTGTVNDCTASGTVIANGNEAVGLGGIGGCLQCMPEISGNKATVKIQTKNAHAVGGLCGYAGMGDDGTGTVQSPCKITNCTVKIDIDTKDATHVGGLVGTGLYYFGMEDRYTVSDCSVSGTIDGAVTPGTVAGRATDSKITSCKTNVKIDGIKSKTTIGKTYQLYQSGDQYEEGSEQAAAVLLKNLKGSYTELFTEIFDSKYDSTWLSACTPFVNKEQVTETVQMLKNSMSGKLSGEKAAEEYQKNPQAMAFDCSFHQNVAKFNFDGNTISGVDNNGNTVFSHTYEYVGYDKETGFYEYQTKDASAGEFTYILLRGDTPATTYHIEFRYGSDLEQLTQFMTGSYGYWMASGIESDCDEQVAKAAITLFCSENLKEQ